MSKQEIMSTRYGEMLDMVSCLSVYNGSAKVKKSKKKVRMAFEDAMNLR